MYSEEVIKLNIIMVINIIIGVIILSQLIYFISHKQTMKTKQKINTLIHAFLLMLVLHYGLIGIINHKMDAIKDEIIQMR